MTEYDFLIYCTQRSGSHMLASALNSHPDISCRGEVLTKRLSPREDSSIAFSDTGITGCILMYNSWKAFGSLLVAPKIIHLVRDLHDSAKSELARIMDAGDEKRGGPHVTHFFKPVQRAFVLDDRRLERQVERKRCSRHIAREQVQDIDHMEISYEEITGNESVSCLGPEATKRLTDFLGVGQAVLTTEFVKPDTVYTIKRIE